jgi:hypothetical protein
VPSVVFDGDAGEQGIAWSSPTFGAGIGIGLAVGVALLVISVVVLRKSMSKTSQYNKI